VENQNQQNSNPQQTQPPTEASGSSYISSSQPKKVLQPSAELVQEVRAEQAERAAAEPKQPQVGVQNPVPQSTQAPVTQTMPSPLRTASEQTTGVAQSTTTTPPQPANAGPSSIYPEATRGINSNGAGYPPPAPVNEVEDTAETYTFDDGYVIGKSIFIYQIIAGIVIGLFSTYLLRTLHQTPAILAIVYIAEYLITLLYFPYYVLRSEKVKEPLWITLIGTAVQTIIIAVGYALMTLILKAVGSLGIFELFVGIGFLVASYFLTKLSWGIAFSLVGKIKNKVIVKTVGICLLALFVGSIAYHYVTQRSNTTSDAATSVQQTTGLTKYQVTGNPSFSVDFYAGSKNTSKSGGSGSLTYSTGHAVQGVNFSISNAITLNATSSCSSAGNNSEFNFQVQGSTGIVCVSNNKSMTSYIGYIQVNGKSYVINMFAFSYQQKLVTVKTIFNSISIN
jgi:hypothetical protein